MNKSNLDFDPFDKQLCYCTVCVKSLKLIMENVISVHHLPLCLILFFVFSSLNSAIKRYFDGVIFQDAVCEECFIYAFGVFTTILEWIYTRFHWFCIEWILNWILVCFYMLYINKITALEYAFIVFSKKKSPFFGVCSSFLHQ